MESVGQKLRDARLRKQLALEDVSAATKINVRNLQAIEADDLAQICSPFTYRSFARQFANYLHVDWAELDQALSETSSRIPAPLVPGAPGAPLPASNRRKRKRNNFRWALSLTSLGLMLGVCSAFYGVWQTAHRDAREAGIVVTGSSTSTAGPLSTAQPHTVQSSSMAPTPTTPQTAAAPSAAPANGKSFRIELSALEQCWLSVATDGKEVFDGVLQPSQTKILEGLEEARIRTGNAGGLTVNVNGRAFGTLGRRGEVRTVLFTKNGYEVLEHAARVQSSTPSGE